MMEWISYFQVAMSVLVAPLMWQVWNLRKTLEDLNKNASAAKQQAWENSTAINQVCGAVADVTKQLDSVNAGLSAEHERHDKLLFERLTIVEDALKQHLKEEHAESALANESRQLIKHLHEQIHDIKCSVETKCHGKCK